MQRLWVCFVVCGLGSAAATRAEEEVAAVRPATSSATGQPTATTERSLTQYGITWTFAQPASAGCFITGDWWVVGPVTVQSVSPAPTADRHGSVVNPSAGDKQGYDDRLTHFDTSLRAKFPLNLKPGDSLVTTASVDAIGDRTADTVPGHSVISGVTTARKPRATAS